MVSRVRALVLLVSLLVVASLPGKAAAEAIWDQRIESLDGGELNLRDWEGRPLLIVNTASLCGFTPQLEGLQTLWETYRDAGLIVLAVPSNDFNQELASDSEVKEFCALN